MTLNVRQWSFQKSCVISWVLRDGNNDEEIFFTAAKYDILLWTDEVTRELWVVEIGVVDNEEFSVLIGDDMEFRTGVEIGGNWESLKRCNFCEVVEGWEHDGEWETECEVVCTVMGNWVVRMFEDLVFRLPVLLSYCINGWDDLLDIERVV